MATKKKVEAGTVTSVEKQKAADYSIISAMLDEAIIAGLIAKSTSASALLWLCRITVNTQHCSDTAMREVVDYYINYKLNEEAPSRASGRSSAGKKK